MEWEEMMRSKEGMGNYAILTRQVNGIKRAFPLKELYEETLRLVENDKELRKQLLLDDIESDCVDECLVF